ncbi:MAG: OmpA family protein, partial [Desulfobacterales bacterium]|nr:OmpA family protein [Desulfobacterales bacterium]
KAGSIEKIFNTGAIKKIYAFSKGYPRLINIVCDHAMLTGYVKEARTIDTTIIKECVKELNISPLVRRGQAKKVRSGPAQHAAPVRQRGAGRIWISIILLGLLALAALLILKTGSSMEGLTAQLKKIEVLITARGRPDAAGTGSNAETRPIKIIDAPAPIKTVPRNFAPVADPDVQPAPANTRLAGASLQKKTLPVEPAPAAAEDSRVVLARVSPAIPESAPKETAGAKDSVIPNPAGGSPGNTPADSLARAKEFMARTGGRLTIHFSYNSNEISKPEYDRLNDFAGIAAHTPEMMILITGHTDTSGSAKYNQKLSKFRANIVKSYFIGKGVKPENIISVGKGLETPLIKSAPGIKSMSNRRVEIEMKLVLPPAQS